MVRWSRGHQPPSVAVMHPTTSGRARSARLAGLVTALVILTGLSASPAAAAVSVARAEVSGTRLRLDGTALASRSITVDGVVMGNSDGSGAFRVERDPYTRPADCTVDVNDGSATATVVRLSGCTVTSGDTTAPTVPTLSAVRSGTTADLTWTTSTDDTAVTGYRVTRNGAFLLTVLNPFYNDTNLPVGTYTYTVAATDGSGNVSAPSNSVSVTVPPPPSTDTTAPTVPTGLTTTVVGTTIGLSWNLSTDDTAVAGYRVTRNGAVRGTTTDTTFSDAGLAPGTYTYTVAAFDGAGNTSAESASASATVAEPEPLHFITPSQMPDATLGEPYLGYIVASDPPGANEFQLKLVSGKVPPGTRFHENTLPHRPEARVIGTPTDLGTYSFAVEVDDGTGATARRTFTITVVAAP